MKIGRAAGYALHAMAYLARQKTTESVSTKKITEATGIPDVFLLKSLKPLVSQQILFSITGPRGGYRLARPADEVTLLEVIEAVEGPIATGSSYHSTLPAHAGVEKLIEKLTNEATSRVRAVLASATVAQLANHRSERKK